MVFYYHYYYKIEVMEVSSPVISDSNDLSLTASRVDLKCRSCLFQ